MKLLPRLSLTGVTDDDEMTESSSENRLPVMYDSTAEAKSAFDFLIHPVTKERFFSDWNNARANKRHYVKPILRKLQSFYQRLRKAFVEISCTLTIQGLCILFIWTLTSFLCHQNANSFLRNGMTFLQGHGFSLSLILTLSQILVCYSLVDVQYKKDKILYIIVLSHTLATFATNCSMSFMYASATFSIKLMEPIISAIAQSLVLSSSISRSTLISLPLVVSGAVVFAGNPIATSMSSIGAILAFSSNVFLAIRNVAMKIKQNETNEIKLRPNVLICSVVACAAILTALVYLMESREVLPQKTTLTVAMMLMSSMFHVIYSYVSTNVVLHYMTVVSHAVGNIVKRIIVVLLLYLYGQRHATPWNCAGLAVCTLGLLVFIRGKVNLINKSQEKVSSDLFTSKAHPFLMRAVVVLPVVIFVVACTFGGTGEIFKELQKHTSRIRLTQLSDNDSNVYFDNTSIKLINQTKLFPDLEASYLIEHKSKIEEFLKWRLLDHGYNTNLLSPLLPTNIEIIREAQRIHFNLFQDILGKFKYAMLFDIAAFENKGDPAITTGEVYLLRRFGIKLVYYCNYYKCVEERIQDYAESISKKYSKDELVILIHGGGNLIGYSNNDILRERLFPRFKGFKIVIFPQSVFVPNNIYSGKHFYRCQRLYCCNPNLTIVLRDKQSLGIALKYWNNDTTFKLAPDMAFQIGPIRRFMSPVYDILWLKRKDSETPGYVVNENIYQHNLTVKVSDWWSWKTPKGSTSMETAFLIMNNGLVFMQRGRVVITDRLHGHILSTLLNIPHVLIDNKNKKLSSYHNTWTRSLDNVFITNDSTKAFGLALRLLEKYRDKLPPIVPFMKVTEDPFDKKKSPK